MENPENLIYKDKKYSVLELYELLNSDIFLDPISRKGLANLLLETIDPLIAKIILVIKPIIADYIIVERRKLLYDNELTSIIKASDITKISIKTIYKWIASGLIEVYMINDKKVVSISQISLIRDKKGLKKA